MNDQAWIREAEKATRAWVTDRRADPALDGLHFDNTERTANPFTWGRRSKYGTQYTARDVRTDVAQGEALQRERRRKPRPTSEKNEDAFHRVWARRRLRARRDYSIVKAPKPRGPKRMKFDPSALTPDGHARWTAERWLDARVRSPFDDTMKTGIRKERDAFKSYLLQHFENAGQSRRVGAHQAAKLTALKHARERAEETAECYVVNGRDPVAQREFDIARMWTAAREALIVYARERRIPAGAVLGGVQDVLRDREPLEESVKRAARELRVTVPYKRWMLAQFFYPLRRALREWAEDRANPWLDAPTNDLNLLPIGAYAEPNVKVPTGGRPRAHDPERVRKALVRADDIGSRMVPSASFTVMGLERELRSVAYVGVALAAVSTLSIYQAVILVGKSRMGTRSCLRNLTRAAAAQEANLPVEALDALERTLEAAAG